jgi:SAM-dependent methyltransferase
MQTSNQSPSPSFVCPCCGNKDFVTETILWPGLVREWGLTKKEEAYINRQQGLICKDCHSNLRSMTLARAMMNSYGVYDSTFKEFLMHQKGIKLLELNEAGNLSPFLNILTERTLAVYPEVDIKKLPYADNSFDMVIHSDTLEHVDDPLTGLSEVLRVLKPGGFTCFTIPVVIGRLSKKRPVSVPSYHGSPDKKEYLVHTEYGSDMWTQIIKAGFYECRLTSLEFPSSVAITGLKKPNTDLQSNKLYNSKRKLKLSRLIKSNKRQSRSHRESNEEA